MTNPASDTITMFGADWCRDCIRTKKQLDELGVAYTYVDLEADPAVAPTPQRPRTVAHSTERTDALLHRSPSVSDRAATPQKGTPA